MRYLVGVLLSVLVSGAIAADDLQLRRLESALDAVRHEQQVVYQQFQMTESLQRTELQADPAMGYVPDGQAVNYDDAVRAKQARQARLDDYSYQLQALSARHRELEDQSRALVDQIRALAGATK